MDFINIEIRDDIAYLINYLKNNMISKNYKFIYIKRISNVIHYGYLIDGKKKEIDNFPIYSQNEFSFLYQYLRHYFAKDISLGKSYISGIELRLLNNISLSMTSDSIYDKNWLIEAEEKKIINGRCSVN